MSPFRLPAAVMTDDSAAAFLRRLWCVMGFRTITGKMEAEKEQTNAGIGARPDLPGKHNGDGRRAADASSPHRGGGIGAFCI